MRQVVLSGLVLLLFSFPVSAQETGEDKKSLWEKLGLTRDKPTYPAPDTTGEIYFKEGDSVRSETPPGIVVTDTSQEFDPDKLDIVQVSEELKIDCVWVTSSRYYTIWDSKNVNPYEFDGAEFGDTLEIRLYEKDTGWAMPLTEHHEITSDFGRRWYRWHYGTDLEADIGDTVRAAFDGIVRISKLNPGGYGYYVMLRHKNGLETLYGHLTKPGVEVGTEVEAGEMIGLAGSSGGSTGPHLHFEVRFRGNAIDPQHLYNFRKDSLSYKFYTITHKDFAYLEEARKTIIHRVRRGDNLTRISRRYGVPIWKICKWNNISRHSTLHVGQRLRVR